MPALSDPTEIENVIYQFIHRDNTLFAMVDGQIFTGLEISDAKDKLDAAPDSALINISYFTDTLYPKHGYAIHHLCTGEGSVQIDIASRKSKEDSTAIASAVRQKILNDININIASLLCDITVGPPELVARYDKDLAAWVTALRSSIEYDAQGGA